MTGAAESAFALLKIRREKKGHTVDHIQPTKRGHYDRNDCPQTLKRRI